MTTGSDNLTIDLVDRKVWGCGGGGGGGGGEISLNFCHGSSGSRSLDVMTFCMSGMGVPEQALGWYPPTSTCG